MPTRVLLALIPCALLLACGRKEPVPPAVPDSPPGAPTVDAPGPAPAPGQASATTAGNTANLAGTRTNAAMGQVLLHAAASNTATSQGGVSGNLQLVSAANGVQLTGGITGLAPNSEHGFHVHEVGDCAAPDFVSAGGHFNPTGAQHGNPATGPHHVGDIPGIKADARGEAQVNTGISGATLNDAGPNDILGKALIVHAKRDDYKTQPSGDSGDRIACGIIETVP